MRSEWVVIRQDFEDAVEYFRHALAVYRGEAPGQVSSEGYLAENAFMHLMQSGYTSLEKGLLAIFNLLDEKIPVKGDRWHETIVRQALSDVDGRGPILPECFVENIQELRRARHVAMHGYFRFEISKATDTIIAMEYIVENLPQALSEFVERIDAPAKESPRSIADMDTRTR